LEDAIEIRRRVLLALEVAEQETLAARRQQLLTFCVIGGGPTGVELAGALSQLSRTMAQRDFRHINPSEIKILLVEGSPHVLGTFSEPMRVRALDQLTTLGVEVRVNSRVVDIDPTGILIRDKDSTETRIESSTVLWGAGVRGSALSETLGVPLDRGGRVIVTSSLNIPGYDEVFCVGDMASCIDENGAQVPGVAPAAIQQGRFVARAILAHVHHHPEAPTFRYTDKGKLATIGRSAAVAELGRLRFSGFIAWLLWLVVHICFLVGFRNRYLVLCQWVWHYFTFQGGARLITGPRDPNASWPSQPRRLGMSRTSATTRSPASVQS
jgi:NADH dehydrogenase